MKNFLAKMLVGDFSNTANQATRQQFVKNFKSTFGIQDDISISDIQAGAKQYEVKGPSQVTAKDIEQATNEIGSPPITPKSSPPPLIRAREKNKSSFYDSAELAQVSNLPMSLRQAPDAVEHQRMMQYANELESFNQSVATSAQNIANQRKTYRNVEMPNQQILDPIQKALREGNFMTKEGMEGIKQNVEAGLGQYAGYSRAGETSGSTFTRFITGMDQDTTPLKTIGGLATLGAMGGLANVMTGGDFTTGAAVTAGAASILRGGGKLFNQSLMSFEENTMEAILKGSKTPNAGLMQGRTARLQQMKELQFTDVNKASKKMRDDLINRKSGGNINTRALTISGGMLSGVAFTGRSDKRDYRRGFNKHRGNRI